MDDDMLRELYDRDVHTWRMNTGLVKHDLGWGSKNFHEMGRWVGATVGAKGQQAEAWGGRRDGGWGGGGVGVCVEVEGLHRQVHRFVSGFSA